MASDVSLTVGTQILFNSSYTPTAQGNIELATPTDVTWDFHNVAADAMRASTKADLTATRAPEYAVHLAVEFNVVPATGETVDLYWAPSVQSVAATGNPAWVSGTDATYTGTPAAPAEARAQLMYIGSMVCSADFTTAVQMAFIGVFAPPTRYGCLVAHNNTIAATFVTDANETACSFTPIIPQGS